VAGAGDADPLLGLRAEALGCRQRDVLRRALGLRQQAVPERLGRSFEVLYGVR
jgi:hypothetical protein